MHIERLGLVLADRSSAKHHLIACSFDCRALNPPPDPPLKVIRMLEALRRLMSALSPRHRRTQAKRRLEAVMREHGITGKLAAKVTNHYFRKDHHA